MAISELTLKKLKHPSFQDHYENFKNLYKKLFSEEVFSSEEHHKILSIIVLFTNQSQTELKKLGYRIALAYGNKTQDFIPLYDIAINTGLLPIVDLITRTNEESNRDIGNDSFVTNIMNSYVDNYRENEIVFTEQQYHLNDFFNINIYESSTIVAPTSYGKSELIISALTQSQNKRICILVPSKALLSQTKKRILDAKIGWISRIVTHPEMHVSEDKDSVYVLTQERLTRILTQDKELNFDMVIVDEAHNILGKDDRNTLLATLIKILEYRNNHTAFKFLTPFLGDPRNLKLVESETNTQNFKVTEAVKSEHLYLADYRNRRSTKEFYDQFINEFFMLSNNSENYYSYIIKNAANKNIIYFNRPVHIQRFSEDLANSLPVISSPEIAEAVKEISVNLNENYLLIHCLKHGVLYHHGSMTDQIRNYAEYLYKVCPEIKYLVTNSTLLEGVNLPVERMFLMSNKRGYGYLKPSHFKNLIGRVSRFSDIFVNTGAQSLLKLQPQIHVIATDEYSRSDADFHAFYKTVMKIDNKETDILENVLLESTPINEDNSQDRHEAMTRLENLQQGITSEGIYPIATTKVGLKLIENNITDINIFEVEKEIQKTLDVFVENHPLINDSNTLMQLIVNAFVIHISETNRIGRNNLMRLSSDKAQLFYSMFLDWGIGNLSFAEIIQKFINYWDSLPNVAPVYVGKWGDMAAEGEKRELFTYMSSKTLSQKVNLAIVRIKEEEDFLEYVIFRYIDILNDLGLLNESFYKLAKYGTENATVITMIKNGLSRGVSELLLRNYAAFIEFDKNDIVKIDPNVNRQLREDKVGFLHRHEVYLNTSRLN